LTRQPPARRRRGVTRDELVEPEKNRQHRQREVEQLRHDPERVGWRDRREQKRAGESTATTGVDRKARNRYAQKNVRLSSSALKHEKAVCAERPHQRRCRQRGT
jgi:hypothetical protein